MSESSIALKLFLKKLNYKKNYPKYINNIIYLGQRSGADLGYRFRWGQRGPYCLDLYDDLNQMKWVKTKGYELNKYVAKMLQSVFPLINKSTPLKKKNWINFITTIDYLKVVTKWDNEKADKVIENLFSNTIDLNIWLPYARKQLKKYLWNKK